MSQHQQDNLAYPHFAVIYIDRYGNLRHETSQSIANSRETILSPWATDAFLRAVARSKEVIPSHSPYKCQIPQLRAVGCPEVVQRGASPSLPRRTPGEHFHVQQSLQRLREPCSKGFNMMFNQKALISLRDNGFLRQYYERAFQNFQQTNCRVLAKAYVKLVEPRKQLNYPYNGRKIVAGGTQQLDPGETKPPWWPSGVNHREPDHLLKAERVKLLVHILCELRTSYGISVGKLKEADQPIRRQISPPERLQILDELYQVREEEEKCLEGTTDGKAVVAISRANLPDTVGLSGSHGEISRKRTQNKAPSQEKEQITESVRIQSRHIRDGNERQAVFAPGTDMVVRMSPNPPKSHPTSPSPTQYISHDLPIHPNRSFDHPATSMLQHDPTRQRQDVVTSVPTTSCQNSLACHSSVFTDPQPFSLESYDELQSLLHQVLTTEQPSTESYGEPMGTYTFPYYFN